MHRWSVVPDLEDEPDGNSMPVARIAAARQLVRSRSDLPMGICLDTAGPTGGDQWEKYINYTDIILADPYPVPNRGLWFVGDTAAKLSALGKPFWIVPQLADEMSRAPSGRELAAMVYLAFIHGASGAVFFKYDGSAPGLDRAPTSTLLWAEASRLALQLGEIGPALHASARRALDGSLLVLAVNTANNPTAAGLSLVTAALPSPVTGAAALECVQLFTYSERCDSPVQIECTNSFRPVEVSVLPNGQVEVKDMLEALGTRVYRIVYALPIADHEGDGSTGSIVENVVPLANAGFEKSTNAGTADS
eukprot:SAG22_NODE_3924_length_1466_cov_1.268471_1_plen_305_part_10